MRNIKNEVITRLKKHVPRLDPKGMGHLDNEVEKHPKIEDNGITILCNLVRTKMRKNFSSIE